MDADKMERIRRLHATETRRWGFHALHRDCVWIFKVSEPVQCRCDIVDHEFNSRWLSLKKDGTVTIYASEERPYAWDGCSPKFVIGKKQFIFGTPDGYRDYRMELPITWIASLVHDAFYQYLHVIPLKKSEVDHIFKEHLKAADFQCWPIYYCCVRIFGGRFIKQTGINGTYYKRYRPIYLRHNVEAGS